MSTSISACGCTHSGDDFYPCMEHNRPAPGVEISEEQLTAWEKEAATIERVLGTPPIALAHAIPHLLHALRHARAERDQRQANELRLIEQMGVYSEEAEKQKHELREARAEVERLREPLVIHFEPAHPQRWHRLDKSHTCDVCSKALSR